MKKNTQREKVLKIVAALAKKNDMSMTAYAVSRGVSPSGLSHLKYAHLKYSDRDGFLLTTALKLGIVEFVKV